MEPFCKKQTTSGLHKYNLCTTSPTTSMTIRTKRTCKSVMDIAVGCYAYGNMFSCMAFKLYLGSSDDIPTEQIEELALFSQFRDAPIPKPRDGHVISGHWRRTRSRASTPVDSERPSERPD